ncbi:MAG TPA: menaquinone biosynthesis protein [Vicinamibacterales bacterium]|nr:menaquinone biosynthesis protein [Vicinamibacterales bacterium]
MIRVGAVTYLNARPLVYGLEHSDRFSIRYDLPSECARLLHAHETDVGLIPSIEYLRGPSPYWIVPGPAVTSRGAVASVAIFTRREPRDIRTIAMDTSSRTSVALATVLLRRRFDVAPAPAPMAPDLEAMLATADAALIIGDVALFLDHEAAGAAKIDLGQEWTAMTGLPFVYACWTGWADAVAPHDVTLLQRARDAGMAQSHAVAAAYYPDDTPRQAIARRYLRDNIQYVLGESEIEGLKTFYRYASELDLADFDGTLRFYDAED